MTESARDEALKLRRGPVSEETRLKMVEAQQNRRAHERRYWLIERGSPAEYVAGESYGDVQWSSNAHAALKFGDKASGETFIAKTILCVETDLRICEHVFSDEPPDLCIAYSQSIADGVDWKERAKAAERALAEREQMWHDIGAICASGWTRDNEARSPNEWAEALLYERDELREKLQAAERALSELIAFYETTPEMNQHPIWKRARAALSSKALAENAGQIKAPVLRQLLATAPTGAGRLLDKVARKILENATHQHELTQIASEIGQYLGWTPGGMATDHERSGK